MDLEPGRADAWETCAEVHAGRNSRSVVRDALRRHASRSPRVTTRWRRVAGSLNMLWVVIGAILVIFMQAGLRAGRDRLLPGQARRARREHELRHLRPRVHRLLLRRLPAGVRRLRHAGYFGDGQGAAVGSSSARQRQLGVPVEGRLGAVRRRHRRRRCSPSSSTWSPSWTPWPRSRPARWPSGGSGAAS